MAVQAAGINAADLMQRQGFYPAPPGVPPDIPGLEVAGEVVAVGSRVSRFVVGDGVMGVVGGGAQAEMAAIDERCALPVPVGLSWAEAGGFPEAFSTAHDALFTQCGLAMGERVLVTAAAGGVGTAGVQLAAAAGATVVASVRSPALARGGGGPGGRARRRPRGGPGARALRRGVGAGRAREPARRARCPGVGGRIAVIGVGSGARVEVDLLTLMHRRARVRSSTLRSRTIFEKAAVAGAVETHVLPLARRARLRVPVEATYPDGTRGGGLRALRRRRKLGKIVLVAPGVARVGEPGRQRHEARLRHLRDRRWRRRRGARPGCRRWRSDDGS